MAKRKSKFKFNLFSLLGIIASGLTFIGLCFPFVGRKITVTIGELHTENLTNFSLSEWNDLIETMSENKQDIIAWLISSKLLVATLILVLLLAALLIINMFTNHKVLNLMTQCLAGVVIVLAVAFFGCGVFDCCSLSRSGAVQAISYYPLAGMIICASVAIVAGVLGLIATRKKK